MFILLLDFWFELRFGKFSFSLSLMHKFLLQPALFTIQLTTEISFVGHFSKLLAAGKIFRGAKKKGGGERDETSKF